MRRIAYSPEVRVYIQPNETDENGKLVDPIDISKDIIEGSVERRTNEISTARFVLQGRRMGKKQNNKDDDYSKENDATTSLLLSRTIRPMDRIIVYLKKTKPILVFSGYIDLAPFVQFVPEPVVIEASCSLKRLKYTYWDPTLPNVMQALIQMGMIVQNNDSGFNVIQPPGEDSTSTGAIEDQGFPKLLSFLLIEVGGWNPETVFIEPLPQEWLDAVEPMFRDLIFSDRTWESAKAFLEAWLGSDPNEDDDSGTTDDTGGDAATLGDAEGIREAINKFIKSKSPNSDQTADDFIKAGEKYNVDPRFIATLAYHETHIGTAGQGNDPDLYNMYGIGGENPVKYPTRAASTMAAAKFLGTDSLWLGGDKNQKYLAAINMWVTGNYNQSGSYADLFPDDWKSMASQDAAVSVNKPYSITGQGIGEAIKNPGGASRNSAADTGTNDRKTLTVYIEAVGSGPDNNKFLKGYQKLDWFARGYTEQSSKNRMAKNRDLAKRVKDRVNEYINTFNELNGVKRDKNKRYDPIDIKIVNHSDVTRGWKGDLYIAIDHSDSERNEDLCYVAAPSVSTPDLINPTTGYGTQGDYGSGWQKPSSRYGRNTVKDDKNLRDNSNNFLNSLGKVKSNPKTSQNGNNLEFSFKTSDLPTKTVAQNAWKGSIPGFFYTAAKGCVYLQLPNKSDDVWIPQTDDWAWHIALALYDYYVNVKLPNGIKQTKAEGDPRVNGSSGKLPYVEPNLNGNPLVGDNGPMNDGILYVLGILQAKFPSLKVTSTTGSSHDKLANSGNVSNHWYGDAVDVQFGYGGPNAELAKVSKWILETGIWKILEEGIFSKVTNGPGENLFIKHGKKTSPYAAGDHENHIHLAVKRDKAKQTIDFLKGLADAPTFDVNGTGTDTGTGNDSQDYQNAVNFNRAAFNVAFSFPGSLVDSVLLRGKRALQNDVPLLDSVRDITIGSMRNFASLPNGDFIAWFPDYFNIARRNPWLRISPVEIKKCTIDISDKSLTTHVYIMGNPYGIGNLPSAYSEWYNKLQGAGVVTIEQAGILDSFLYTKEEIDSRKQDRKDSTKTYNESESAISFLEKYGARPYAETNLTLRHPIIEFFYAYNTFITKWAEQFISRVEFTFMPELFPGMIIEIPNYEQQSHSFSFYVQEVVHTFSYTGGFSTSAVLIAPGEVYYDESIKKDPLGLVPVRAPESVRQPTTYSVAPQKPPTGSPSKKKYKEWLNGRKSTAKLAAEWKKLQGIV